MSAISLFFVTLRYHRHRLRGVQFLGTCRIAPRVDLRPGIRNGAKGRIQIGLDCELDSGALLDAWGGEITLGHHTFVGPYTVIYGHGGVTIGDNTLISMHSRIVSSNHAIPPLSTDVRSQPDVLLPTRIGRDVWLGAGVTVLGGVTIGDGCIVGAGAVVSKDLPAGAIALGVPAVVRAFRKSAQ